MGNRGWSGASESRSDPRSGGHPEPASARGPDRVSGERPTPANENTRPGLPPSLLRPFRLIAFDWDGTAVENRRADASAVREVIERLLREGVQIAVITGTHFGHVDRQLASGIHGPHKRRLHVLTNRGSEVWGFDEASKPVIVWHRVATPEEEAALTATADSVRAALVARTGLDIRVVYDRLNRRKVDLIPLPEWTDPPKSEIGALTDAVESRLRDAGLEGGIGEAFRMAERLARQNGLEDARITSDVKHLEIGLTDKSDSIDWLMHELARAEGIRPVDVLIGGDEFGRIAGFEGSDARMLTASAEGATFVSVGPEPGGAPPEVIHLGGGPARFRELLEAQLELWRAGEEGERPHSPLAEHLPVAPTSAPDWCLVEEGFNVAREHEIESVFSTANGYVGTRGSLAEGTALSAPATFISGVYDVQEHSDRIPRLAQAPNWTRANVWLNGERLDLGAGERLEHRRILDLRQGLLWREWRHRDPNGRIIRMLGLRLVSLADRHALLQTLVLTPENFGGTLGLELGLEQPAGGAANPFGAGVSLVPEAAALPQIRRPHGPGAGGAAEPDERADAVERGHTSDEPRRAADGPRPVETPPPITVTLRTRETDIAVAFAATAVVLADGVEHEARELNLVDGSPVARYDIPVEPGGSCRVDQILAVHTSRDAEDPAAASAERLRRLVDEGADAIVEAHVRRWRERWHAADVEVTGDDEDQRALRFACYHLISAADPRDERVSIGARALTGPAYSGHVFWDTEIYMLPFYLYTHPPAARSLLMYRYHTLPAARDKAREHGFEGAFFAWESAADGRESTPPRVLTPEGKVLPIFNGEQEVHIVADVAYAVWQYWQATGDDAFLRDAGAEILLETARFWASRGRLEDDGRFHIRHVIGPDEYHVDVDDNAYTNGMARWNLERGADAARIVAERWPERWRELSDRLELDPGEPDEWRRLADIVAFPIDPETGVIEQFEGYHDLEEIDLEAYEPRTAPMDVILGHDRIQRTKIIKQPDVLMLIHLLWDRFTPRVREANFRYYDPRTGHGSSLSPSIHALLAARLGMSDVARRYFRQGAEIDLADNMGNAAGGVHMAALGGLWQAAIFGFGGVRTGPDGITLEPKLPPNWKAVRFPIRWRGESLYVSIDAAGAALRPHEPVDPHEPVEPPE